MSAFGNMVPSSTLSASLRDLPAWPRKWNQAYFDTIIKRSNARIEVLDDRLFGVTNGRTMPEIEQVTIGTGRRFKKLAILFLDICSFSARKNWTDVEQKQVMVIMNVFMAEMINIVRDWGGTFEKNTGDGLMAYFGEEGADDAAIVRPAVEAAAVMHYANANLISPSLETVRSIEPIRFRIGIDLGPVSIARVGLRGRESSIVAVGTPANIACKLMNLIPGGGICIGDEVYKALPANWDKNCAPCAQNSGFVYTADNRPYRAWELNHRLLKPVSQVADEFFTTR